MGDPLDVQDGLVLYYTFDDIRGNTAPDHSPGGGSLGILER